MLKWVRKFSKISKLDIFPSLEVQEDQYFLGPWPQILGNELNYWSLLNIQ